MKLVLCDGPLLAYIWNSNSNDFKSWNNWSVILHLLFNKDKSLLKKMTEISILWGLHWFGSLGIMLRHLIENTYRALSINRHPQHPIPSFCLWSEHSLMSHTYVLSSESDRLMRYQFLNKIMKINIMFRFAGTSCIALIDLILQKFASCNFGKTLHTRSYKTRPFNCMWSLNYNGYTVGDNGILLKDLNNIDISWCVTFTFSLYFPPLFLSYLIFIILLIYFILVTHSWKAH